MSFRGIYPILYAYFDAEGRLDESAMRRQVRGCLAAGAHGIAVLGLITEVASLSADERRAIIAWSAEEVAATVPLAVTIAGRTVDDQIADAREATALGADWVIFQPPEDCPDEASLLKAFGRAADALPIPFGIQNAPQFLGRGLSTGAIETLHRAHPNFSVLKGETSAVEIERLCQACGDGLSVFNGRGGMELPDILRAGCVGLIPAPECFDIQVRIFEAMARGDEAEAEALYAEVLPLIVFVMQSVEASLIYGKRVTARRLGLGPVHDRNPALFPTPFGLARAEARSARLGPFPSGAAA